MNYYFSRWYRSLYERYFGKDRVRCNRWYCTLTLKTSRVGTFNAGYCGIVRVPKKFGGSQKFSSARNAETAG